MQDAKERTSVLRCPAGTLSQCNFCTLRDLGAGAARQGKFIQMVGSNFKLGGHDAHAVDFGEEPNKDNWVGWFMKVTTKCACDDC